MALIRRVKVSMGSLAPAGKRVGSRDMAVRRKDGVPALSLQVQRGLGFRGDNQRPVSHVLLRPIDDDYGSTQGDRNTELCLSPLLGLPSPNQGMSCEARQLSTQGLH